MAQYFYAESEERINIEAVSEEEMMFDAGGFDALMQSRKGTGLLRGPLQDLHKAAIEGDWKAAQEIFKKNIAKNRVISTKGFTALHAAASCGRSKFVVELVEHLDPKDLEMRDQVGRTALHHVAAAADVSAAEALVKKNPQLVVLGDYAFRTPILYAAGWRRRSKTKEMLEYLHKVTAGEPASRQIYGGDLGANLVVAITASQCYDIALRILADHPDLALGRNDNGRSILYVLAMQPASFISGSKCSSVWELLIKGKKINVQETKQRYGEALGLVEFVCKELRRQSDFYIFNYFFDGYKGNAVLHLAVENGVTKLVEVCLKYFPDLIWYTRNNQTLLHAAIEHRRVNIFNHLIRWIGENTMAYAKSQIDENDNNILHFAAQYSTPTNQLMIHTVPGPAFEMRRELQWFKAMEMLVSEELTMEKNKAGKEIKGQVPRELFFKEHKQLLKEAKEWMKDTSNSCMLVATLVATVAFAAMITVPGGNNSNTGLPVLSNRKLFVAFSISNALSMISSAMTLLMFLSVYTSRFTEDDFLETFPKILLRGLISLFIAIATMMIAFGTAIGLVLQRRVKWAYIPITVIACCPALIFTKLQLPLLFQTIVFAPGPGQFQGQRDRKSSLLNKIGCRLQPKEMT